jgi:hypothetical protein
VPDGEWYCEHEDCVVRQVRITAKYLDGPPPERPPAMSCPACGRGPMTFHHYIRHLELVPVTADGGEANHEG